MVGTTGVQYQHFVPQFLLKNFSHPYKPSKNHGPKTSKRSKRKHDKRVYPGERVVHNLNLSVDPPAICETPVNRILGQMDMYRDTSKPSPEQQHIELMFSELEREASTVFRKITKSFEQHDNGLWLTRDERDLIRKFLFLLKYRGSGFRQRFYHDNAEGYKADDRELLHDYMAENGYERPIDVWFHNLKTIMELRMDPEGKWMKDLPKRIYASDALWFISHAQFMYMAICTPANPSDDFILTDNSYNVFEGPNISAADEETGKIEGVAYTPLHEFAPISPKLMIVLRSAMLPVPEEDANAKVKEERDSFHSTALGMVYKGEVKSLLADLPINKARNNCSEIIHGRVQLINGEDGKKRKDHKFCFTFYPIETEHINVINGILLDNAYRCSSVVFKSIDNFSRTLEWYLTTPFGKLIAGEDADLRLKGLKKLAEVSKSLGSEKKPIWSEESVPIVQNYEKFRLGMIEEGRLLNKIIKSDWNTFPDTDGMQIYKTLDGSEEKLLEDVEQAALMWKLRVKIDVWSKGLDESLRRRNRELLIEIYLGLPPRRVWMFSKHLKIAFLAASAGLEKENSPHNPGDLSEREPEDTIAQGMCRCPLFVQDIFVNSEVACHIIKPHNLAQLMYKAVANDVKMKQRPGYTSWAALDGHGQIMLLEFLVRVEPSYIRDCGIDEIEELAQKVELEILKSDLHNQAFRNPFFEDDEKIEILTRIMVRSKFMEALKGKLELSLLKVLKSVFFEILYPTPNRT